MEKLVFADGDKLGVFDGETVTRYESASIARYRENALSRTKNDDWKYGGEGARFRGDYEIYRTRQESVRAYINGVQWEGEKIVYSYSVNDTSGVYRKDVRSPKSPEEHIISSSDNEFLTLHNAQGLYAVTVQKRGGTAQIGTLNPENAELQTLTDGDSRDANAFVSPTDGNLIYFDSAGVGRNADGEFTGKYAPSVICSLDRSTLEIKEIASGKKHSYVKPRPARDGTLYCIRRPTGERRGGNPIVEMLLIPFRILQAIVMFIQAFVVMFTGKSLTSGGDNPAKGRNSDSRKLYVDGNLIEAEREHKRNQKFKDKECGFIPMSWKLIKISEGKEETLKSGVCDFALCKDGGLYYTNGKHVFCLKDGERKKIADTDVRLSLATESVSVAAAAEPFRL